MDGMGINIQDVELSFGRLTIVQTIKLVQEGIFRLLRGCSSQTLGRLALLVCSAVCFAQMGLTILKQGRQVTVECHLRGHVISGQRSVRKSATAEWGGAMYMCVSVWLP